jgi:hypothetical protein
VSANALPAHFTPLALFVAIASFLAASLCWFLYFAASPKTHIRLPSWEAVGSYRRRMFKMGDVLSTVLFCYAHIGLVASLPLLASGFARLVEASSDKKGGEEEDERNKEESKLLISMACAAFMVFSGVILSFGSDGEVMPGKVPPRKMNPQQRGLVRACIGIVLGLCAGVSCVMVDGDGEVWPVEIWGGVVCLALALSAHLETRPSDLRAVPSLIAAPHHNEEAGTESSVTSNAIKRNSASTSMLYRPSINQRSSQNGESSPSSIELHHPRSRTLENDPTFFGDSNPMRLTTQSSTSTASSSGNTDL